MISNTALVDAGTFDIMGGIWSEDIYSNEPDLIPYDSEEDMNHSTNLSESGNEGTNRNLDTDASNLAKQSYRLQIPQFTQSDLEEIVEQLDDNEKVSLIFLLSTNPRDCLDNLTIHEWAQREANIYWHEKLVEALTIIQNFQILRKFGLRKETLIEEFLPFSYYTTKHVDRQKKVYFRVFEKLTDEDEKKVLQRIQKDFKEKGLYFREYPQLETSFSYFHLIGYLTERSVKNVSHIFKVIGMDVIYDMLNFIETENEEGRENQLGDKMPQMNRDKPCVSSDFVRRNIQDEKSRVSSSMITNGAVDSTQSIGRIPSESSILRKPTGNMYDMSKQRLCLIIDQENFYREIDETFRHLLPEDTGRSQLNERTGTKCDSTRLKYSLENRKFKVNVERNLTHGKMITYLSKAVESVDQKNCSCFFVTILSHGDQGIVYGSNSCKVQISEIIDIMSNKKLSGIPKVLILQSCQGPSLQKVTIDEDLSTDGPTGPSERWVESPDFLLFSSTVPGYSSIRDKTKGTWFIQSLCDQLDKIGDSEHFEDICTNINADMSQKTWKKDGNEFFMVSIKESTFTGKMYLK